MPNKKEAVEAYILNQGIIDEAQIQAEIKKMADQLAPATAAEKGLTTDIDKAYETMMIMTNGASASPAVTQSAPTSAPTVQATAAEQAALNNSILQNFEEKLAVGQNSRIVKYLLSRPAPASYIPENTMGTVVAESWNKIQEKINSGVYRVLDDYTDPKTNELVKSKSNYDALVQAATNGTPVAVYRGAQSTRPQGYVIMLSSGAGAGGQEQTFTRDDAMQLLIWKCNGYLGQKDQPTIRLKTVKGRTDPNKAGQQTQSKTVMTDYNKSILIQAGGVDTIRKAGPETKEMTLKSDLSFRVEEPGALTSKGVAKKRLIRPSVTATAPVLVIGAEYVEKFGQTKKDGSEAPTSPEQIKDMAKIIAAAKLTVLNDSDRVTVLQLDKEYRNDIQEAQKALQTQAPVGAQF